MDSNPGMTGDPNQQNRQSVFAFDPYRQPVLDAESWAKLQASPGICSGYINVPTNPQLSPMQVPLQIPPQPNFPNQPFLGEYTPPCAPPIMNNYGVPGPIPGRFSFGPVESKPSEFPVQFPFTTTTPAEVKDFGESAGPSRVPAVASTSGKSYESRLGPGSFFHNMSTQMNITNRPPSSFCDMSDDFYVPLRGKRKNKDPPPRPMKQHITEEIMAEHMSNLHINSESDIPDESENVREKRLYMCAEMRKLQTDPIIPQTILNKMNQPCTALVLWTPPPRIFPSLYPSSRATKEDTDNVKALFSQMDNEPSADEITIEAEGESGTVASEMDYDL